MTSDKISINKILYWKAFYRFEAETGKIKGDEETYCEFDASLGLSYISDIDSFIEDDYPFIVIDKEKLFLGRIKYGI